MKNVAEGFSFLKRGIFYRSSVLFLRGFQLVNRRPS
jgi:hypothetical protein